MGGESCTVLRLRWMRKLAMSLIKSIDVQPLDLKVKLYICHNQIIVNV